MKTIWIYTKKNTYLRRCIWKLTESAIHGHDENNMDIYEEKYLGICIGASGNRQNQLFNTRA